MLYDDLPAPQGSGSKSKTPVAIDPTNPYADLFSPPPGISTGPADNKPTEDVSQDDGIQISKVKKPAVSLVFKPRQTSIKIDKQHANAVTHNSSNHHDSTKSSSESANFQTNSGSSEVGRRDRAGSMDISQPVQHEEEEDEPFNTIASFDVENPYDPRRPNDYSSLLAEREENARIALLEKENRKKLQAIDKERQEREKQRKDAAEKGDFKALIEQDGGRGRGRGRGVNNLPAWITQQMSEDKSNNNNSGSDNNPSDSIARITPSNPEVSLKATAASSSSRQFEDSAEDLAGSKRKIAAVTKPSTVVVLCNLLSHDAAAADDSFLEETRDECARFGHVLDCKVCLLSPQVHPQLEDEERVRVFVQFEKQEGAVKAYRGMNGRNFGGRVVSVSFFDEDRFREGRLEP
eukprot:gene39034-47490_t